jgi:hypothetical protein
MDQMVCGVKKENAYVYLGLALERKDRLAASMWSHLSNSRNRKYVGGRPVRYCDECPGRRRDKRPKENFYTPDVVIFLLVAREKVGIDGEESSRDLADLEVSSGKPKYGSRFVKVAVWFLESLVVNR